MTIIEIVGRLNYIPDKKALLISFLITLSGCASVSNSEDSIKIIRADESIGVSI